MCKLNLDTKTAKATKSQTPKSGGSFKEFLASVWEKRPKWPGLKKLFGPILLLLAIGLLVAEILLIQQLKPDVRGKQIDLSSVYRAARACLVNEATFLDHDSVIFLKIYDAPPAAPAPPQVPIGTEPEGLPVCAMSPEQTALSGAQADAQAKFDAEQQAKLAADPKAKPDPNAPPPVPPAVEIPEPKQYWAAYPSSDSETTVIVQELFNGGAEFNFESQTGKARIRFVAQFLIPLLILATVFSFFFLIITGQGGGAAEFLGFSKFAAKIQRRKKGKGAITFADVAAIDEGITELQEVVDYLVNPQKYHEMGAKAPKGVLLAGPPGTGKTLLAKSVAGESNVPFIQLAGSEFVESLVGVGAARVRSLFAQARSLAPCIVFIDELDAAGRQRGAGMGQGNDEREQTLNQLLVEMDGFSTKLGIVIMGATNRPDILDPALLRPGRFDRQIVIDVPDVRGRAEILGVHARGRPMAPDCDLQQIAKECPGFTGADLANIMNEAALMAVRRERAEISQIDLEEAVDRVVAGPERRSHILTHEEKLLVAYHEAGHAVVARGAGQTTGVLKLSIIARGLNLGHASTYSSADRLIMLRSEVEAQLAALMGGLAAEKLIFGQVSTGNTKDLEQATTLARKLVATYGMTEAIGGMQVLHEGQVFMGRDFAASQHTSGKILDTVDDEIQKVLRAAEKLAIEICKDNREVLDEIVRELIERESMVGPQLEPILAKVKQIQLPTSISAVVQAMGNLGTNGAQRRRRAAPVKAPE